MDGLSCLFAQALDSPAFLRTQEPELPGNEQHVVEFRKRAHADIQEPAELAWSRLAAPSARLIGALRAAFLAWDVGPYRSHTGQSLVTR